jgi:peptide chain release factor 1
LPLKQDSGNAGELLPMSELKIDTMRSSGAGGQHVNTTNSAVRITHIPTGITASIQDERSQHKNKAKALKLISARVRDKEREEEQRKHGKARSMLLGGGDRSERIRTYNYPQDRVTDHRCKHTTHGISKLLDAGSDDGLVATFYPFLQNMAYDEQIAALHDEE